MSVLVDCPECGPAHQGGYGLCECDCHLGEPGAAPEPLVPEYTVEIIPTRGGFPLFEVNVVSPDGSELDRAYVSTRWDARWWARRKINQDARTGGGGVVERRTVIPNARARRKGAR